MSANLRVDERTWLTFVRIKSVEFRMGSEKGWTTRCPRIKYAQNGVCLKAMSAPGDKVPEPDTGVIAGSFSWSSRWRV